MTFGTLLASENSRHLATLPLVSPPNDVCSQRRNERKKFHTASDLLNQISHAARPIRSTTQIWVMTRHQCGISALVSQTSFGGETSGSVAKSGLFSQAKTLPKDVVDLPRNLLDFKEHVVHLILRKYVGGRIHSTTRASVQ